RMEGSRWDFIVDQSRMSRVVEIREVMSISELKEAVLNEFFPEGSFGVSADHSYWPPHSSELVSGITTPLVLVTNRGGIKFFFKHFHISPSMNIFVSFGVNADCTRKDEQNYNARETNTPAPGHFNAASSDEVLLSSRTDFNACVFSMSSQGMKRNWHGDGFSNNKLMGTSGSTKFRDAKPTLLLDLDDAKIIDNVQQAEEEFFKHARSKKPSTPSDGNEDSDYEDYHGVSPDVSDVRPVDDPLAGSDAADIMCPPSEGFDAKAAAMGMRREYIRFTKDAFDHSVVTGNLLQKYKYPWLLKSSYETGATSNPESRAIVMDSYPQIHRSTTSKGFDQGRPLVAEMAHFSNNPNSQASNVQTEVDNQSAARHATEETYSGVIYLVENAADEEIPPELTKLVMFPPRSRIASDRRKETRCPSAGEIPVSSFLKLPRVLFLTP
ncbi:unnamed protein product, partial [Thlaspi arvense]